MNVWSVAAGIFGAAASIITHRLCTNYENTHIVFDLDHTLLHSMTPEEWTALDIRWQRPDIILGSGRYVYLRRWTMLALRVLSCIGHVHIFSAGSHWYVKEVARELDPFSSLFYQVFSREWCRDIGEKLYSKDLKLINPSASLESSLLIDDRDRSFVVGEGKNQERNGIQITPFHLEKGQDNELLKVMFLILRRKLLNPYDLQHEGKGVTVLTSPDKAKAPEVWV